MKTIPFINIPAAGSIGAHAIDPLNRAHVAALIRRAEAYFELSARTWQRRQDSTLSDADYAKLESLENEQADNGAALLAPLGIQCTWPGLYPAFLVNGHEEHGTREAVLTALGHARDWLPAT